MCIHNRASEIGRIKWKSTHARRRIKLYNKCHQIIIACCNIETLNTKVQEIIPELNEHKIDIRAISEKSEGIVKLDKYALAYTDLPKDKMAIYVVGMLVYEKYKNNNSNIDNVNDRVL